MRFTGEIETGQLAMVALFIENEKEFLFKYYLN